MIRWSSKKVVLTLKMNTYYFLHLFNIDRADLKKPIPGIYKFTCLENGRSYIGKSEKNVYFRLMDNIRNVLTYPMYKEELHNDLKDYGFDKFKFEILAICPDSNTVNILEPLLIAYERAGNNSNLYNTQQFRKNLSVELNW
jgi:GIY-YIG catalytic domain